MPRRVYTYGAGMHWASMNGLASFGALFIALSVLTTIVNFATSRRSGVLVGANPWNADSLEWAVASPPPAYNFLHIPVVSGPNAVWDATPDQPYVTGMRFDKRELLVTRTLDAEPDHREEIPGHSWAPLLLALTTSFGLIGSIFYAWYFTLGAVITVVPLVYWFWPKKEVIAEHVTRERGELPAEDVLQP